MKNQNSRFRTPGLSLLATVLLLGLVGCKKAPEPAPAEPAPAPAPAATPAAVDIGAMSCERYNMLAEAGAAEATEAVDHVLGAVVDGLQAAGVEVAADGSNDDSIRVMLTDLCTEAPGATLGDTARSIVSSLSG